MSDNRAFISYRRAPGYPWARLIWEDLAERDIDAFLDLESMRSAGTFDDRLLNQIASRPYFLVVLTAGTLERCADPSDWVRREIEHAIEHDRIIVPVFIAPFEPSGFPTDLPQHIGDALRRSQGLTVYSQYLSAAIDKLAFEMLTPVDLASPDLTEEDARFQSQTVREIRSLPAPTVPETPAPDAADSLAVSAIEPPNDVGEASTPPVPPTELPTAELPPVEPAETVEPDATEVDEAVPTIIPVTEPVRIELDPETDDDSEASSTVRDQPASHDESSAATVPVATTGAPPVVADRRRPMLIGLGVVAALVLVGGLVAIGVSGGGGGDGVVHSGVLRADVWLRPGDAVRSSVGEHELVVTAEGRLQLLTAGELVWQPSYAPRDTASAILQRSDGNLVVYAEDDADSDVLWASGTTSVGQNGSLSVIDDDGEAYVVIEDANGSERWRTPDRGDVPRAELDAIVDTDRDELDALVDVWVVQLGAKVDGQDENGRWDHERILDEFDDFVADYEPGVSVVLARGSDFNLNRAHLLDQARRDFSEWYFTLLLGDFDSRQEGIDWCEANRPGNCGVKLLSADALRDAQTYFSPSSE